MKTYSLLKKAGLLDFSSYRGGFVQIIHDFVIPSCKVTWLYIYSSCNYSVWVNGERIDCVKTPCSDNTVYFEGSNIQSCIIPEHNNRLCFLCDAARLRDGCTPHLAFAVYDDITLVSQSGKTTLCRGCAEYGISRNEEPQSLFEQVIYDASKASKWLEPSYVTHDDWQTTVLATPPSDMIYRPAEQPDTMPCTTGNLFSTGSFIVDEANCGNSTIYSAAYFCSDTVKLDSITRSIEFPKPEGVSFLDSDGRNLYILVDLTRCVRGWFTLDIDCSFSTAVDIAFLECSDDIIRAPLGGSRRRTLRYVATQGRQIFTHYLDAFCCRYIQINVNSPHFKLYNAGILPVVYKRRASAVFKTSDRMHNAIYKAALDELNINTGDFYITDPFAGDYVNIFDARNHLSAMYYYFDDNDAEKLTLDMCCSFLPCGLLALGYPQKCDVAVPSASLMWIIAMYENMLFCGDRNFIKRFLPKVSDIINVFLDRMDDNGLVADFKGENFWNFYEWSEGLEGFVQTADRLDEDRYSLPLNALLSLALNGAYYMYGELGYTAQADACLAAIAKLNPAIGRTFWDNAAQLFASFNSHGVKRHFCEFSQVLAIKCGAADTRRQQLIMPILCKSSPYVAKISTYNAILKYEILISVGEKQSAKVFNRIATDFGGDIIGEQQRRFYRYGCVNPEPDQAYNNRFGLSYIPIYVYFRYAIGLFPAARGYSCAGVGRYACGFRCMGQLICGHNLYEVDNNGTITKKQLQEVRS